MNDTLQIIDKYNSLYTTTMIFFGILMAFIGVIIPIFIYWYQNRILKIEKENLKTDLFKELSIDIDSYFKSQEEKFEEKIEEIEEDFKIKTNAIIGGTLHIQGNNNLFRNLYGSALDSYLKASIFYILGEDEYNLQTVNINIIEKCLPKMNKSHFEEMPELETPKNDLIKLLEVNNINGRYTDTIKKINRGFEKAIKLTEPK